MARIPDVTSSCWRDSSGFPESSSPRSGGVTIDFERTIGPGGRRIAGCRETGCRRPLPPFGRLDRLKPVRRQGCLPHI